MSDNFVTCRHCGIGINYACDHEDDDVPAEEMAKAVSLLVEVRDQWGMPIGLQERIREFIATACAPAGRESERTAGVTE